MSQVAASEQDTGQTGVHAFRGCGQPERTEEGSRISLGNLSIERERRVGETGSGQDCTRVPRDTGNPVGSRRDHPPSLNTLSDR